MMSYFSPKPRQKPKRLPRRRPIKAVPSGIGDEGIVGNWLFYYLKGGDHLHDFSPEDNHGTINGASWKDGGYGWALEFDGVDDLVDIPDSDSLDIASDNTYTIAFWYKSTNFDPDVDDIAVMKPVSGGGVPRFLVSFYDVTGNGEPNMYFQQHDGTNVDYIYTDSFTPDDGNWHFVVCVRSGSGAGNMDIYIDGSVPSTAIGRDEGAGGFSNAGDLSLGGDYEASKWYLQGTLTYCLLYNVVKSGSWVSRRFNRTRGIFGV